MSKKSLNPRQKNFVREYAKDFNATQAYIRAGYSKNGARVASSRLLALTNIQSMLKATLNKGAKKAEITQESILNDLRYVADVCLGFRSVTNIKKWTDEDGVEKEERVEVTRFNPTGAVKALEVVGKHIGMFRDEDKQDINALFITGVRAFITQEAPLPRDRKDDRLGNGG